MKKQASHVCKLVGIIVFMSACGIADLPTDTQQQPLENPASEPGTIDRLHPASGALSKLDKPTELVTEDGASHTLQAKSSIQQVRRDKQIDTPPFFETPQTLGRCAYVSLDAALPGCIYVSTVAKNAHCYAQYEYCPYPTVWDQSVRCKCRAECTDYSLNVILSATCINASTVRCLWECHDNGGGPEE